MDLQSWLKAYLKRFDPPLSDNALAHRLGYTGNAVVSRVRNGSGKIPKDDIEKWADVLEVEGDDRTVFIRLANLTWCTPFIQLEMERIRQQTLEMSAENARAWTQANDAKAEAKKLKEHIQRLEEALQNERKSKARR